MTPKLAEEPGTMEVDPASVEEPEGKRLRPPADQDAEVASSGVGATSQSSSIVITIIIIVINIVITVINIAIRQTRRSANLLVTGSYK